MSYADTKCPCGGKKAPDTMICPECEEAFRDTHEYRGWQDTTEPWGSRRRDAIRLLSMCRRRRRVAAGPMSGYSRPTKI